MHAEAIDGARNLIDFARSHAKILREGNPTEEESKIAYGLEEDCKAVESYLDGE